MTSPTEDDYYATLNDNLNHGVGGEATGAYDVVASQEEYARFRRALMRWIEMADQEWDQLANDEEHDIER